MHTCVCGYIDLCHLKSNVVFISTIFISTIFLNECKVGLTINTLSVSVLIIKAVNQCHIKSIPQCKQ